MSDTMISDSEGTRDNIIPGRLKTIVLDHALTISYAGPSIQALDRIRDIRRRLDSLSLDEVIQLLSASSAAYASEIDFILCSHMKEARLVKITREGMSEGAEFYWIGNQQAVQELSQVNAPNNIPKNLPDYITPDELAFSTTFSTYLRETHCEGVGGGCH